MLDTIYPPVEMSAWHGMAFPIGRLNIECRFALNLSRGEVVRVALPFRWSE